MIKRCKFIVALALCLCVFAYDTVSISSDWGGKSIAWATDPTFSKNALVLSGQLGLYFYMKDFDTNTAGTMNFDIANTEADPSIDYKTDMIIKENSGEQIETQKAKDDNDQDITLHGFRCDVNAIQMADEIIATYKYTKDSTETTVTNSSTIDSVEDYLNELLKDTTYSTHVNLVALVNAIKDYGHFAQKTLADTNTSYGNHTSIAASKNYNADNNDNEEKNFPTTATGLAATDAIKIYTGDNTTGTPVANNLGITFTLDLDSKTALRVYLPKDSKLRQKNTTTEGSITDMTTTAATGNTYGTYEINTTNVTTPDSDSEFQIVFSNISAHQLGDIFTIPVTINNTSYTIVISPMSYVYAVTLLTYEEDMKTSMGLDDNNELTRFKQAVVALYNYYEKTLAYRKAPTATN